MRKKSDEVFFESAEELVRTVQHLAFVADNAFKFSDIGMNNFNLDGKRILDFGCGPGRFLTGLELIGVCFEHYVGVDVEAAALDHLKATRTDASRHSFELVNIHNERYNPKGDVLDDDGLGIGLREERGSIDLIHLRSVFSHMTKADIAKHLMGLAPLLRKSTGRMVVSLFVSVGVQDEEENPDAAGDTPLRVVLLNKAVFEQLVDDANMQVLLETTFNNQQTYVLGPGRRKAHVARTK